MNFANLERLLTAVYAEYLQLEQQDKAGACERILALMSSMMREMNGRKRKLAELENAGTAGRRNGKQARSNLVRKSNAASPQKPIKPVQTTRKNELRR